MSDTLSVKDAMELLAKHYENTYLSGMARNFRSEKYQLTSEEWIWIKAVQAAYALGKDSVKNLDEPWFNKGTQFSSCALDHMEITVRQHNILKDNSIESLTQIDRMTNVELGLLPGIGKGSVLEIRNAADRLRRRYHKGIV